MTTLLKKLATRPFHALLNAQQSALAPTLPRTQSQVMVIAAHDNCLILRDGSVVAAVGVGSIDDSFLSERELQAKLDAFRDFLKRLRFEVQVLIGTRPQNLNWFMTKLDEDVGRLQRAEGDLKQLKEALLRREWSALQRLITELGPVTRLRAGEVLSKLADANIMAILQPKDPSNVDVTQQAAVIQSLAGALDGQVDGIMHWQAICYARMAFLETQLQTLQAPVRTFYFVTSVNPRLLTKHVRRDGLREAEFASAQTTLSQRCEQLQRGVEIMGLSSRRCSHDELVTALQREYHG